MKNWANLLQQGGGQVVSLAKEVGGFVAKGMPVLSEEQAQQRLSICGECEFFISAEKRCGKCGCYMEVKAKMATTKCPIGKWSAVGQN